MSLSVWRDDNSGTVIGRVDVAIIGGGIAGLAIARRCVLIGLVPAVIEARDLAAGATGRNAGFAMTGLAEHYDGLVERFGRDRARAIWETSQRNLRELVDDVAGREKLECDLVPCGSVIAAWTHEEHEHIARSHTMLREDGFDVALLDRAGVAERLGSQRFESGLLVRADHGVHPVKLVRGLAQRVRDDGGTILEQHEVRAIEDEPGGGLRVRTSRGDVIAPRVVLATNAYTRLLEPYFDPLVKPMRGQVLATEPVPPLLHSMVYTDGGGEYARQLPDGRVVAGGWRKHFADEEVGYSDETTPGVQGGIERFLAEAWPDLARARVTHRWSGVMGFSPDALPMVGSLPGRPRVSFAVGFTGHGLGFAFAAARALIECFEPRGDGGIFDARRFSRPGG